MCGRIMEGGEGKEKGSGDENPTGRTFFKIIYGMEAYLVDDLQEIVTGEKGGDFHGILWCLI